MSSIPEKVRVLVAANPQLVLLNKPGVLEWLHGEATFKAFLPPLEKVKGKSKEYSEKLQALENEWGRKLPIRGKKGLQWTNNFGEMLVEELYILQGKKVTQPKSKEGNKPDREIDTHMLEAKAETHFTTGTAGEKILGVPYKYADVPRLFGKPLIVVVLGGAEVSCRNQYGIIDGPQTSPEKKKFLAFFKEMGIDFIGATEILAKLSQ